MSERKYAIITPAYNEEAFLNKMIESVAGQKLRPVEWIIVDDRSTDSTWSKINAAAEQYSFIKPVRLSGQDHRLVGANIVHVFDAGLAELTSEVDFIVKMDADIILPSEYFAKIAAFFEEDAYLGMVSGKTYIQRNDNWVLERIPDTHVSGACKAYRKQCFEDIEGLIPILGWDILDGVKARMKGWKTQSFRNLPLYHLRQSSSAKGMLRGRIRTGRCMYIIRAHPLFVLGKSIFRAIEKPYLTGLLIPLGYLMAHISKPERLHDLELGRYLRREQLDRLRGRTARQEELIPKHYNA